MSTYTGKHRMSGSSEMPVKPGSFVYASDAPGVSEISLMRALSDSFYMSEVCGVSVSPAFDPSVTMCAACGEKPAESRNESVFALCEGCCEVIRWRTSVVLSGSSDFPGLPGWSEMSDGDRMTAVWRDMHGKYGYAMMDAALAEMSD